jgi:hypothetical protein
MKRSPNLGQLEYQNMFNPTLKKPASQIIRNFNLDRLNYLCSFRLKSDERRINFRFRMAFFHIFYILEPH